MATELDLNKQRATDLQGLGAQGQQTTGGSTAVAATPAAGAPKAGSGRFVNLQRYMQAGKGQQFGEQVAGKIQGQGQESKQAVGQASEAFKAAAAKGTVAGQAGLGGQGMTAEDLQQAGKAFGQQAIVGAEGLSDQGVGQFQKLISGQYAGPNQLENVAKLRAQAQAAQQTGNLAQSTAGQQQLLGQLYGRPSYTGGQQKLDTLLLGTQQDKLKQARQQTLGLERAVEMQSIGAAAQAQRLAQEDALTKQALRDQLESEAGRTRKEAEEQAAGARYTLMDQWKNASKGSKWAALPGESLGDWISRTGGGAFAEDIKRGGPNFTVAEAADPAKQAKLLALGRLGGGALDMSRYTAGLDPSKYKTASQRAGDVEGHIRGVASRQSIEAEERAKNAAVNREISDRQNAENLINENARMDAERNRQILANQKRQDIDTGTEEQQRLAAQNRRRW